MRKTLLFLPVLLALAGCIGDPIETPSGTTVTGLRPIYFAESEARKIVADAPQPIVKLGKIYYKDQTIYVNERNLGVHIIDNTDPANPVKKGFLHIPGCNDIAIKGNTLYADNVGDFVAIDISDPTHPIELKRIPNLQGNANDQFPQFYEGYFECVDASKGIVAGWEEVELVDPKCWK